MGAASGAVAKTAAHIPVRFGVNVEPSRRLAIFFALLALFVVTPSVDAQIGSTARVAGTVVTSPGARPVAGTLVTIRSLNSGTTHETTTAGNGSFSVPTLQPGPYEIRVEALGYRPLVVRGLVLFAGDERSLALTITVDPPPVERIDTLTISSSSGSRNRAEGLSLGNMEMRQLPYRFDDIGALAAMESSFDERLGAEGLPGELTVLVADGVPVYRATHPNARSESLPSPLFGRNLISGVSVLPRATDVTLPGAAGGHVSVSTRRNSAGLPNVGGSWSADPLWSSSKHGFDTPTLLSWQGFGNVSADVAPGSRLFVAADGMRHEAPMAIRLADASGLSGLAEEDVQSLQQPGVQSVQRIGGLARFDRELSTTDRFFMRAMLGVSERTFTGAGPIQNGDVPEEAVDFSTAFGYVGQASPSVTLDLRGGVSGSYRDFALGGLAPASLGQPAAALGSASGLTGSSTRTDIIVAPGLVLDADATEVRVGLAIRASRHSMERADAGFSYTDEAAQAASVGYGYTQVAPMAEFTTREFGLYSELRGSLSPTLSYVAGARYDLERLGENQVSLGENWLVATGLVNNDFARAFHQFGGRFVLNWTPIPGRPTRIRAQASVDHGDINPRSLYTVTSEATNALETTALGGSVEWPDPELDAFAPLAHVSLFGPDLRAPRTVGTDLIVLQGFGQSTVVTVRGSSRRTDFVFRRRNLNLPVVASGQDAGGRPIWGTLTQDGALVAALGGDSRRFNGFGVASALDPDGWSEYRGVTASLDHTSADVSLFGSYTWSETTDNWFGAQSTTPGADLLPGMPVDDDDPEWSEGVSDFDVTHRASVGASVRAGPANLSAVFRFESGLPFTPGYRFGVDANGDGSAANDVALTSVAGADAALSAAGCTSPTGAYAERNSCRASSSQTLNVRLAFDLSSLGVDRAQLTVDVLNAVEAASGVVDSALLLVDPTGAITTATDGTVTLPTTINPDFGSVIYPTSMGRMIRVGFRIGA